MGWDFYYCGKGWVGYYYMFKELTYFEFLEDDLKGLQNEMAELNRRLVDAYSPPEKVYCSLKEQIDNILA